MENTKIYQTLENKENPDEVENDGPFHCNWRNSWLGDGYYFWDSFIENAHWWGVSHCNRSYIICEAVVDLDDNNCFDLVGNTKHLMDFGDSIDFMKEKGMLTSKTTVSRVIHFMQSNRILPNYSVIRAYGINSKSKDYQPNYRIIFEPNRPFQYLPYKPEIQLCILKFNNINFRNYKIVYPDEYIDGYAI
ncbi:hypothetical protein [Psychroflexus planctonicus]|uniref:RES domain-containing protein n=1 Tax=Psychroflexus planctonicus TaxID=1526575 RepID=A0ABQ1SF97_9FLAO|nr:hypothetical protein [Psychroflexus planctonicus]GGE27475.1 hypothetical protein GCM10010832_05210 [Psychroflexus planctonicus]